MSELVDLYKARCKYQISDTIQELDFKFDLSRLKTEMFEYIVNNKFGFKSALLKLPIGENNYIAQKDEIEATGVSVYDYDQDNVNLDLQKRNDLHNKNYSEWHPNLTNSYICELTAKLEQYVGLTIGKIRLNWLLPNTGYTMHVDVEPLRIHIPLLTNDAVYYIHDHKLYTMKYGKIYHLITSEPHTVWNFGKLPRLHLIFTTYDDDELDKKINDVASVVQLQKNFVDHVNSGIDQQSLCYLFKILNSNSDNNRDQTLFNMQLMNDLLYKNNNSTN